MTDEDIEIIEDSKVALLEYKHRDALATWRPELAKASLSAVKWIRIGNCSKVQSGDLSYRKGRSYNLILSIKAFKIGVMLLL